MGWVSRAVVGVLVMVFAAIGPMPADASTTLLRVTFNGHDGLVTNEFAHWNPGSANAVKSKVWDMTSGSLFARSDAGWTGVPDTKDPNARSTAGTDSAVFRLTTRSQSYKNVRVSFNLDITSLGATPQTPKVAWDGVHIFLRYQNEYHLYYASVDRRDGAVVIKKKCSGGDSNGGTYYELTREVRGHPIAFGRWQVVSARVVNNSDGSVSLSLYRGGSRLASAVDRGTGCAPITHAGAVGIRGDNANFRFDNFTVTTA